MQLFGCANVFETFFEIFKKWRGSVEFKRGLLAWRTSQVLFVVTRTALCLQLIIGGFHGFQNIIKMLFDAFAIDDKID